MNIKIKKSASCAAYTLIEVTIAASILMIGVGAACVLTLTVIKQEEGHLRVTRAINLMENAARLYHLGMEPADCINLLPKDPITVTNSFTYRAPDSSVAGEVVSMPQIGNPQAVMFSMNFYTSSDTAVWVPGTWGGRPDTADAKNKDSREIGPLKVYRSSFRP